jgi:hypothetical protein
MKVSFAVVVLHTSSLLITGVRGVVNANQYYNPQTTTATATSGSSSSSTHPNGSNGKSHSGHTDPSLGRYPPTNNIYYGQQQGQGQQGKVASGGGQYHPSQPSADTPTGHSSPPPSSSTSANSVSQPIDSSSSGDPNIQGGMFIPSKPIGPAKQLFGSDLSQIDKDFIFEGTVDLIHTRQYTTV